MFDEIKPGRVMAVCFVVLSIAIAGAAGCERNRSAAPKKGGDGLRVLTSFLPVWVFTKNVAAGVPGVEVDVLIPGEQGPHHYQLTPGDMKKLESADLFIANGLNLEEFLTGLARESREDLEIVEAGKAVRPMRVVEQDYYKLDRGDEHGHGRDHGDVNPHTFASPRDAALMVERIAAAMGKADPEHAEAYRQNGAEYAARLRDLSARMREVVQSAGNRKVVTFHNSFDYLARDTGLEIVGVIESVPGQHASAGELAGLARRLRKTGAAAIFSEPQYSDKEAQVLSSESGVPVYVLDPAATGELEPGVYLETMEKNLAVLREALHRGRQ